LYKTHNMNKLVLKSIKVAVFANEKLLPAFDLVKKKHAVIIYFSDWSIKPGVIWKNIRFIYKSDITYFHSPANLRILLLPIAKLFGKKTMLQWIGGDVLIATHTLRNDFYDIGLDSHIKIKDSIFNSLKGINYILNNLSYKFSYIYVLYLKLFVDHHVACAEHIVEELKLVNITANYLPLVNPVTPEILPWPNDLSILTYTGYFDSADTKSYYGWNAILRLANDYRDLKIYAVGRAAPTEDIPKNIEFLSFIKNIKDALVKVKGVVRASYYDGTPRIIIVALATGRYVAYTKDFPNCTKITSYNELKDFIDRLKDINHPNTSGYEYITNEYSIDKTTALYLKEFQDCINSQ